MTRRIKTILIVAATSLVAAAAAMAFIGRSPGTTLGQSVNAGIDNLLATAQRLLELPVTALLGFGAVAAVLLALPVLRWGTRSGRIRPAGVAAACLAGIGLMSLALAADRKIQALQDQVMQMRGEIRQLRMAGADPVSPPALPAATTPALASNTPSTAPAARTAPSVKVSAATAPAAKRNTFLFDNVQVPKSLTPIFGPVSLHPVIQDQATDVIEVDMPNLPAIAYLAVVDLKTPGVEVKFGGSLSQKTMTSEFARTNNCVVAINGEAGASPLANSGLGVWHGNMISAGKVVLKEDAFNRRPFLSFDRQSNVTFTAQSATDRAVKADAYNVIWGRMDAVIDNKVQAENERDRQPRTAMGISADGGKLYLMVVDGRQQRYSIGFVRAEVGSFLQAFGAANGMLCDEGGSSCIYMKKFGGIVNSPSDGAERPTYTHFGISLKTN